MKGGLVAGDATNVAIRKRKQALRISFDDSKAFSMEQTNRRREQVES